jgi:hypothetical protein
MNESNNLCTMLQHSGPIWEGVGHNKIDHEPCVRCEDSANMLSMPSYEPWADMAELPSTAEEMTPLPFLLRMALAMGMVTPASMSWRVKFARLN